MRGSIPVSPWSGCGWPDPAVSWESDCDTNRSLVSSFLIQNQTARGGKKQKKKKQDLMTNLLRCRRVCRLGRTLGVPAGLLPGDALLSALLLLSVYTSLHCSCGKVNKVAWTSSSFPANHCSHQRKVVYRYWLVMDNSLTQPIGTLTIFVLSIETSQKWLRQVLPEEINCQIEKCWCEKFLVIYGRIAS